ncbi:MAG: amidohydrolase [Clostridium sp.]|jgi:amidohydrolase
MTIDILKEVQNIQEYMIKVRRYFHMHPELSEMEYNTQTFIIDELDIMGIEYEKIADTGVMGIIRGKNEKKVIGLRSDMDALPMEEANEVIYKSIVSGVMHACGHDAHMSILLGTAKILKSYQEFLDGTIKLFFQPAEESVGGANRMINQGCMIKPNVNYTIGLHVMPYMNYDMVELKKGCLNASTDEVKIIFNGKASHGAYPDQGSDSIVISSEFISSIQGILSRKISPLNSAVLTFGTIIGGTKPNIVASKVEINGTLRTIDGSTRQYLKDKIKQMAIDISKHHDGTADVIITASYPAVFNDDITIELIEKGIKNYLPNIGIQYKLSPSMGGEDFSYFSLKSRAAYYSIGCKISDKDNYPLHSIDFDIDERCLMTGASTYLSSILTLLKEGEF